MDIQLQDITTIDSGYAGSLSFFESGMGKEVPFDIKRIYYIHDVPDDSKRGAHAHKALRQFIFCPYGCIELLFDDTCEKISIVLDNPRKGILVEPGIWRDMVWHKENSVLCVAASDYYDAKDYIRDYNEFVSWKQSRQHL